MALRARKVSGAFEKRAPEQGKVSHLFSYLKNPFNTANPLILSERLVSELRGFYCTSKQEVID